jgi:hypothetical protein
MDVLMNMMNMNMNMSAARKAERILPPRRRKVNADAKTECSENSRENARRVAMKEAEKSAHAPRRARRKRGDGLEQKNGDKQPCRRQCEQTHAIEC